MNIDHLLRSLTRTVCHLVAFQIFGSEIEIDDGLQCLAGGAVTQRLG